METITLSPTFLFLSSLLVCPCLLPESTIKSTTSEKIGNNLEIKYLRLKIRSKMPKMVERATIRPSCQHQWLATPY